MRNYKIIYKVDVNNTPGIENMVICINVSSEDDTENIWELECYACQWIQEYMSNTFGISYKNFTYEYDIERM